LRKTSITLGSFKVLKKAKLVQRMLVIAPLRPCFASWAKEQQKWTDFNKLDMVVLHGPKKYEFLNGKKHDIYVINPEGTPWLFAQPGFPKLFKGQALVVDESSKYKDTRTQRFRMLKPLLNMFSRRWILTGSPAPNGLIDLFGQVYIVDTGRSLGRFVTEYRRRWFAPTGYGGYTWVPVIGAEKEIYTALKDVVMRMDEKDYLTLPPIVDDFKDPVVITLPPKARKIYDQMENQLIAKLKRGEVVAANAAVASMKCRQIANGGLYLDDHPDDGYSRDRAWQLMHNEKTDATVELAEELSGQPTLIAYDFHHDLARLRKAFPKAPHLGSDGVKAKDLTALIAAWNRYEIPVLLVNPKSVAHGIDELQQAGHALIWHSLTWSYEDYMQLVRRLYRSGQKRRVFVYHIVAKDTVDSVMMQVIAKKGKTQGALLDALRNYYLHKG
jgi:SNF2 family DNA or RNA helicase